MPRFSAIDVGVFTPAIGTAACMHYLFVTFWFWLRPAEAAETINRTTNKNATTVNSALGRHNRNKKINLIDYDKK